MFDSIFSFREKRMIQRIFASAKGIFSPPAGGTSFLKRLICATVVIAELIGALFFNMPQPPRGQRINLDEWTLSWSDEFDGDSLDTTKWNNPYDNVARRGGFWDKDQVFVENGVLKIRTEYKENEQFGSGWYTGAIETKGLFEQKYGYFECRCICPGGIGLWAAFWTLGDGMFAPPDGSAADGCEIDMFESGFFKDKKKHDAVNQATGFDGYGEGSSGVVLGHYSGKDIFNEYNTFGLEWNENEIIFYINGIETDRLSGEWVPHVKQYLLLSVEVAGKTEEIGVGGQPVPFVDESNNINDNDMSIFPLDFVVDYVRAYQRTQDIEV